MSGEPPSVERWRRINVDATLPTDDDRPHQVTATPLAFGGGFVYHCNACGYIDATMPPTPCVPQTKPTWAKPASYEPCVCDAEGRCTRWSHDHSEDPGVTSVEPGCTCGGMAACIQCQDRDACAHDWTLRPESDTRFCEICGDER